MKKFKFGFRKYLTIGILLTFIFPLSAQAALITATSLLGHYTIPSGVAQYDVSAQPSTKIGVGRTFSSCVDTTDHFLFVDDPSTTRVMVFSLNTDNTPATNIPSYVLGATDFTTLFSPAASQSSFRSGGSLACDSANSRLFVGDGLANRILVFNVSAATLAANGNGENASYVIGQSNFTATGAALTQSGLSLNGFSASDLAYDSASNRLFVADTNNDRVMVFPVPTATNLTGENASVVVGEPDFVSNNQTDFEATATHMLSPSGVAYDAGLNRLFVADSGNNRVMVFPNANTLATGATATIFLGQTSSNGASTGITAARMNNPLGLAYDSANTRLFVADKNNNRVTEFNAANGTLATNESATFALGQTGLTVKTVQSTQNGLNFPQGVSYDSGSQNIFVADSSNSRLMVFPGAVGTLATNENASYVFGRTDVTGAPLYDAGGTDNGLNFPQPNEAFNVYGIALDTKNHRMFVEDYDEAASFVNARILVYPLDSNNKISSPNATYALGWSSLYTVGAAANFAFGNEVKGIAYDSVNERIFVADQSKNRVIILNVNPGSIATGENASYVLGQINFSNSSTGITQSTMNAPSGVAYDSTNSRLFVNDSGNNRVLVYDVSPATLTSLNPGGGTAENASYVIGQADFTHNTGATTQAGLNESKSVGGWAANMDYDSANTRLFVPSPGDNRVLIYPVPTATNLTGENASYVFGQTSFTGSGSATTQNGFNKPMSAVYDPVNGRLFIGDKLNNRTMVFDATPATLTANGNGENAQAVIAQTGFTSTANASNSQQGAGGSLTGAYNPVTNTYFDGQYFPDRIMEDDFVHITTSSLPSGNVGTAYSQSVAVSQATGSSRTYSLFSGTLPAGLTLNSSTGLISGTPTAAAVSSITVEADDNFSDTSVFFDRSALSLTTTAVAPATPSAPTASVSGVSGTATVTLVAPANNGSSITGYAVSGGGTDTNTGTTSLTHTITGLTNGTPYTFTFTATNGVGTSSASPASNPVTPYTTPGIPTIGTATAGVASAIVTFTAPGSDGGSAITSYTVTSSPGGITSTGSSSPITVTGLTGGTPYTFTVHATNAAGSSAESSATSPAVTPTVPPVIVSSSSSGGSSAGAIANFFAQQQATPQTTPTYPSTTPTTTYYNFGTTTLRNGSRGTSVKELQRFLNDTLNLGLKLDGILGPKTIAVIKTWQKVHNLVADGLVGVKTKAMMNSSVK